MKKSDNLRGDSFG